MVELILFGTLGCHLCEEAELVLAGCERIRIESIDIAEQEQWQEKYAIRIPVLYHPDTKKELCWPFSQEQAQVFIDTLV
ncbi:MAG: glutaredoxin family protein [Methylococcales bacterium]|nr:glutaredoxin family protein [Methylococcales bacterium]MCK5478468.1 glutaredoxin family protein [Methylococcales bacterium]